MQNDYNLQIKYDSKGIIERMMLSKDASLSVVVLLWPSGGVRTMYHLSDKGLRDGVYYSWHESGGLDEAGQFEDGAATGVWRTWHKNGQLASTGRVDGSSGFVGHRDVPIRLHYYQKIGIWRYFGENGEDRSVDHGDGRK